MIPDHNTITLLLNEPSTKWMAISILFLGALSLILVMLNKMLRTVLELKAEWLKPKKTKDYSHHIQIEQAVSDRIRYIKHDLRADRVSIYQYKNGEKSIANIPFLKLLITHESLSSKAESVQIRNKELNANVLGHLNLDVFTGQPIIMPSLDAKTKDNVPPLSQSHELRALYQLLVKYETKSVYLFPMVKTDGTTIGFGMVEYIGEETMMDDHWVNWSIVQFAAVGGILSSLVEGVDG